MIVTMFGSHIGDQILEIGKSANQFTIFVYKSQHSPCGLVSNALPGNSGTLAMASSTT